jgi:hypothetical protein
VPPDSLAPSPHPRGAVLCSFCPANHPSTVVEWTLLDRKSSEFSQHPAPPVKIRVDSGYLKSRARVTVPGFRTARSVASRR